MQGEISEDRFLGLLRDGVNRTREFMGRLTEYHGGPTETEYILTSDIARAFLDAHLEVAVEWQNRHFVNAMTVRHDKSPKQLFGGQRTDVAVVFSGLIAIAMIEVKIGIGSRLNPLKKDLNKLARTLDALKAKYAAAVRAASVFQVYVKGRANEIGTERLERRVRKIEASLSKELSEFAKGWPDFTFQLAPLLEQNAGIVDTEVIFEEDGSSSLGAPGHATRYYAIIIRSTRQSKVANSFKELMQEI